MKRKLIEFMQGRYGTDSLSKFMMGVCLVLLVINMFTGAPAVYLVALVLLGICYFRMFSKNYAKRSMENQKFMNAWNPIRRQFVKIKNRIVQSKDYHFYKCPSCGQTIRIPRGKGKICITCPKCRQEFEKKS